MALEDQGLRQMEFRTTDQCLPAEVSKATSRRENPALLLLRSRSEGEKARGDLGVGPEGYLVTLAHYS